MAFNTIAEVKHPNLAAERRYCQCNIPAWADHANVSIEVMENVLHGTDDLTREEALGLAKLLIQYGPAKNEYEFMEYLFSNKITNIMLTEEIQNRLWDLKLVCDVTLRCIKQPVDIWYSSCLNNICHWFDELQSNKVVPYALIRNYLGQANDILVKGKTEEKRSNGLHDRTSMDLEMTNYGI